MKLSTDRPGDGSAQGGLASCLHRRHGTPSGRCQEGLGTGCQRLQAPAVKAQDGALQVPCPRTLRSFESYMIHMGMDILKPFAHGFQTSMAMRRRNLVWMRNAGPPFNRFSGGAVERNTWSRVSSKASHIASPAFEMRHHQNFSQPGNGLRFIQAFVARTLQALSSKLLTGVTLGSFSTSFSTSPRCLTCRAEFRLAWTETKPQSSANAPRKCLGAGRRFLPVNLEACRESSDTFGDSDSASPNSKPQGLTQRSSSTAA